MTAHLPYADLTSLGGGAWQGAVEGHPVAGTLLRVQLLTPTERSAGLWANGKHLVGVGLLRLRDGKWCGHVDEFAGRWFLSAEQGSGRVVFREHETADA